MRNEVIEIYTKFLIPAVWNYKKDGTKEEIEKLARSIEHDKSAGVLAVREVPSKDVPGEFIYEVIDGNHRLEAIKHLGWESVHVENFGPISLPEAITVAKRRNHQWFEDDFSKLSKLMIEEVIPNFEFDDLLSFMPDSEKELEAFRDIEKLDSVNEETSESYSAGSEDVPPKTITLKVNEEVFNIWMKWLERTKKSQTIGTPERAFEFAIIEALNMPEDSY